MADGFILGHIRNLPLFAHLPQEHLAWVGEAVQVIQLPANAILFQQGQPAQGLYLIVRGGGVLLHTSAGTQQVIGEVHPNQYVGESALFENVNERMTLRLTEDSIILFLSRLKFQETLLSHPEIRQHLTGNYAQIMPESSPTFRSQRENEQLLLQQQRHYWTFIRSGFPGVVAGLILLVLAFLVASSPILTVLMTLASIAGTGLWLYYTYVEWQNDFLIVTNQRVIRIERTILSFEEAINEVPISSIHEVNYVIPPADIFARIFNYGTIFVKTAGESGNMTLTLIPNPREVQQLIMTNQLNFRRSTAERDREAISAQIDQFLNSPHTPPAQSERDDDDEEEFDIKRAKGGILSTRFFDERGNLVYRKHLSIWAGHIFMPLMGMIAAVVVAGLSVFVTEGITLGLVGLLPAAGLFFVSVLWLYWADWDWRNDMLVIGKSTGRIIHRRPLWLEDENVQFLLSRVDSVASDRDGILNTVLNRGTVHISLVGDDIPRVFRNVPRPYQVQDEISDQRARVLTQHEEEGHQRQREEIVRYLDVYHEKLQNAANAQPPYQPPPPYGTQQGPPPAANPPPSPPANRDGPRPPRIPRSRD